MAERYVEPMDRKTAETAALTVYYDGACPLCRREVSFYRRLDGEERIVWEDVSKPDAEPGCDLSRESALQRFHARRRDGQLESGAAAFVAVWRQLPGFRVLAPLAAWPPVLRLLERAYRGFLKARPWISRQLA